MKTDAVKKSETKEQMIARLIAKAELDYKCCGQGRCNTIIKKKAAV